MAGGKCVGSPKLPCQKPKISGRFGDLVVKCGDQVDLRADATNIPDKTPTIFNIRHYTKKQTVATEKALLKSSKVSDKEWISKKVFQGWDPPHLDFKVSANGASADSDNRLRIYQYPDFAPYPKIIPRLVPPYEWTGKYDLEFKDRVLIITVKIKLINRKMRWPANLNNLPPVNPADQPVEAKFKKYLKRDIEGKLSERWVLHRDRCRRGKNCSCNKKTECCKFRVRVQVEFVEANYHHEVNLFFGKNNWMNTDNWVRIPPGGNGSNAFAHEVGHLLGWYDEYPTGACGPVPWKNERKNAIMYSAGPYTTVPQLYYQDFKGEFRLKTDEPWDFVSK